MKELSHGNCSLSLRASCKIHVLNILLKNTLLKSVICMSEPQITIHYLADTRDILKSMKCDFVINEAQKHNDA